MGAQSTALGYAASTSAASGTALGTGASAPFTNSTAVGAGAETSSENQVVLGAPGHIVEVPFGSSLVLSSPNGTRWAVTVDDAGSLTTTSL